MNPVAPSLPANQGLCFSDFLLLGVLSLATLLSVSFPVFGLQLHHSALNHASLMLFAPVFALHLIGKLLNHHPTPWARIFGVCWPLLALASFALIGSSIAKWGSGLEDTYLSLGIYLSLLPLYAASGHLIQQRGRSWMMGLVVIWFMFSLAALVGEIFRFRITGTLHEVEYLIASGFFALYYVARSRIVKWVALGLLVAAFLLNQKLTGYIVLAMALLHMLFSAGWQHVLPKNRRLYGLGALVFAGLTAGGLALLYFEFRQYLPSGNPHVRLAQYEAAWLQFLQSPIWGNAYLKGSGEIFNEGLNRLYIPTHSDVLDILKHGGLIGFALFAWGYWKVFALFNAAIKASTEDHLTNAYFVALRFFQVTALITFMINPLLLKGPFLVVIWGNLGFGIGLALAVLGRTSKGGQR